MIKLTFWQVIVPNNQPIPIRINNFFKLIPFGNQIISIKFW